MASEDPDQIADHPDDAAVVVVTGAGSGIGRATATELARQGATVIAVARRAGSLHELARSTEHLDGRSSRRPPT